MEERILQHLVNQPHDGLVKYVFSDVANAVAHFEDTLPSAIAKRLDHRSMQLGSTTIVDATLSQQHCDLIFEVAAEGDAVLYVLFEHQRTVEPQMGFRMVRYVMGVWDRWRRGDQDPQLLPPVLPIVLYNGKTGWSGPRSIQEMIGGSSELRASLGALLPRHEFLLQDVAEFNGGKPIPGTPAGQLALRFLGAADEADITQVVRLEAELVREVADQLGWAWLSAYAIFLMSVGASRRSVIEAFREVSREAGKMAMSAAQRLLEEGERKGHRKGRADQLLELLDLKFGALDAKTRSRIETASEAELSTWARRLLDAESLDDVFESTSEG